MEMSPGSLLIFALGFLRHSFCLHRQQHLHTGESHGSTDFFLKTFFFYEDGRTALPVIRQPCVREYVHM